MDRSLSAFYCSFSAARYCSGTFKHLPFRHCEGNQNSSHSRQPTIALWLLSIFYYRIVEELAYLQGWACLLSWLHFTAFQSSQGKIHEICFFAILADLIHLYNRSFPLWNNKGKGKYRHQKAARAIFLLASGFAAAIFACNLKPLQFRKPFAPHDSKCQKKNVLWSTNISITTGRQAMDNDGFFLAKILLIICVWPIEFWVNVWPCRDGAEGDLPGIVRTYRCVSTY